MRIYLLPTSCANTLNTCTNAMSPSSLLKAPPGILTHTSCFHILFMFRFVVFTILISLVVLSMCLLMSFKVYHSHYIQYLKLM